ncbi:Potassium-transporting ATPase, F subunit, putative (modular protein) [uncultured Mycobacterium sp.]|uniref:Potassium-transporting ATPase, F subunit, putative (Modular protein) n=1 Tax=uncultured Mycobacterium sp. TaxID=171292 RepID=A0A1Y5PA10_9MYCO|nr:Potassium-transporting ATPase, F subunit, putative (modular protein) [uncultured Mycobacterium sp.]
MCDLASSWSSIRGPGNAARAVAARTSSIRRERRDMGVVIYILLTVAIFALLGLVQKLVERL